MNNVISAPKDRAELLEILFFQRAYISSLKKEIHNIELEKEKIIQKYELQLQNQRYVIKELDEKFKDAINRIKSGVLRQTNEGWFVEYSKGIFPLHPDTTSNKRMFKDFLDGQQIKFEIIKTTIARGNRKVEKAKIII